MVSLQLIARGGFIKNGWVFKNGRLIVVQEVIDQLFMSDIFLKIRMIWRKMKIKKHSSNIIKENIEKILQDYEQIGVLNRVSHQVLWGYFCC